MFKYLGEHPPGIGEPIRNQPLLGVDIAIIVSVPLLAAETETKLGSSTEVRPQS